MKYIPFEPEKYYHLFNRGNNQEKIFLKTDNYRHFLRLVSKHLLPICEVFSYCLIPNHFHFIIKIKDVKDLPKGVDKSKLHQPFSNLFNAYSKAFNKQNNRRGSLFQEHLKRIEISSSEYLRSLIIYVNTNSSHHNIGDYKLYEFSSYSALLSNKETNIERDGVIYLFDSLDNLKFMFEKKKDLLDSIKEFTFE